jgi:hypothetical protein
MVWATFWAIFSQTHPVTLLPEKTQREREKKTSSVLHATLNFLDLELKHNVVTFSRRITV